MNDDYYSNPNDPQSPYNPQGDAQNPFAAAPEESPFTAEQLRQHLSSGAMGDDEKKKSKLKLVVVAIAVLAIMAVLMVVMGVFSSSEPDFNAGSASDGLSMSGSDPMPAPVDGAAPAEGEVPFAPPADAVAPIDSAAPAMDGITPDAVAPADAAPVAPADPFAPLDEGVNPAPDAAAPAATSGATVAAAADDFATKCATKFNDDIKARGQNPDQYPTARDDYVKNCVEYLSKQAKPQ